MNKAILLLLLITIGSVSTEYLKSWKHFWRLVIKRLKVLLKAGIES